MDETMKTQQIWLLLDSSKAGGIESHVFQLATGLHQHGINIRVVFLTYYGPHPLRDLLNQQGIANMTLNGKYHTLWHTLQQKQPAVLHTHGYKAGIFGRLAAKLSNTPVITTYHAGEIASGKLAFYDKLDRVTAGLANQVFAVSPHIAARLPVAAEVVNNFIDTHNISHSKGSQIAFVGRISTEKGPDHFARLASICTELTLHMYGDGPQLDEIKNFPATNLDCHGQQDDMTTIWPNIGLLVIPSRHEGLPMAALEAMARGIPVLAYHVGALDRLITSASNGWLIEPGNLKSLAQHLRLWQEMSESDKQQMRAAARATIDNKFSSHVAIPALIASYNQVSSKLQIAN